LTVPGGHGDFVEEKTGAETASELLESEPLEHIWLLTFSNELHGSPLRMEVVHGVFPCVSRVLIILPTVLFLSGCPVWDFKALEQSTGLTVHADIAYALK